jgi:hypothetical protein
MYEMLYVHSGINYSCVHRIGVFRAWLHVGIEVALEAAVASEVMAADNQNDGVATWRNARSH